MILLFLLLNWAPFIQNEVSVRENRDEISISIDGKRVLQYRKSIYSAPEGQSPLYGRSGFIHPLRSPQGFTFSRIQPADHYHHYGLWNPWTHTLIDGDTVDFWNLDKGQATVRYRKTLEKSRAGFKVLQEHVVFGPDGEEVVLNEELEVIVAKSEDRYIIDHNSTYSCPGSDDFQILAYRYQGFGFRAVASWNQKNVRLLTSGEEPFETANFSRGNWVLVEGPNETNGRSGLLFMGSPENHNSPQLFRIWPPGSNGGVENIFINFNPAYEKDWLMQSGNEYSLNYRIVAYDGVLSPEEAEDYWTEYKKMIVVR